MTLYNGLKKRAEICYHSKLPASIASIEFIVSFDFIRKALEIYILRSGVMINK